MNFKLALSGTLSAALLVGCGSAPKLTNSSGEWEDLPFTHASTPHIEPVVQAITAPAPEPVLPLVTPELSASVPVPPKVHRVRKAAPKPLASPVPEPAGTEATQAPAQDTKCTAD
jgi:hypothetical protein